MDARVISRGRRSGFAPLLVLLGLTVAEPLATAMPRRPLPSIPVLNRLWLERFDEPYRFPTNQVVDSSTWVESWSGWALSREQAVVQPWVVPMATTNRVLVDPERGAIRFWYRPGYDSGTGPGGVATLVTLVSTNGGTAATWWSLAVSSDGSEVQLVCQTEDGPTACLSASPGFSAGTWTLITLGYTETNSALWIGSNAVVSGSGLASVPAEAVLYTSLVVGSDISGQNVAAGQMDELVVFSGQTRWATNRGIPFGVEPQWHLQYYTNYSALAARGPVSDAELAAQAEARAARL